MEDPHFETSPAEYFPYGWRVMEPEFAGLKHLIEELRDWGDLARGIIENDEGFQELVRGEPFCMPAGIISENYETAEVFVMIGEYQIIHSDAMEGQHLVGGKIYEIVVDLNENTVKSIEEVKDQALIQWIENCIIVEARGFRG